MTLKEEGNRLSCYSALQSREMSDDGPSYVAWFSQNFVQESELSRMLHLAGW